MNQWVEIDDRSAVAVVRRLARRYGAEIGLSERRLEELAIVVTEASTNILRYAERGRALVPPCPLACGALFHKVVNALLLQLFKKNVEFSV